jgi:hypothetical protein
MFMNAVRSFLCSLAFVSMAATPAVAQFGGGGLGGGGGGMGGGGMGGGGMGGGGMGGVYLDAQGTLRSLPKKIKAVKPQSVSLKAEIAKRSDLRQVSLKNIDAQLRSHLADGGSAELPEEIRQVAGLHRIDYILIDKANKDVLLCGPAEGWVRDVDGRAVGKSSKRPAIDVADIAAALRCVIQGGGEVKCSIDPRKEGLAKAFEYDIPAVNGTETQADEVRKEIQERLGMQTVMTDGIPAGSRFARAIVDADYRMKRMAMGLDKVAGLFTHADAVARLTVSGSKKTNMARWWFTPAYEGVECDADETVFRLLGPAMKLLNEEVLVDETGTRRGTGRSSPNWDQFSQNFTRMLPELEKKNTAFADLHNLYDLTMFAGIMKRQGCADWFAGSALLDEKTYSIPTGLQPKLAEPVVTTRVIKRNAAGDQRIFLSVALGGVSMNPGSMLSSPGFVRPGGSASSGSTASSSGSGGGGGGSTGSGKTVAARGTSEETVAAKSVGRVVKGDDWWSDAPSGKE